MRLHHPTPGSKESLETSPSCGMGAAQTFLLFGGATLLLFVAAQGLIPMLARSTSIEPILLWFAVYGLIVFIPLPITSLLLLHREGKLATPLFWRDRLRFRSMKLADWLWSLGAVAAIGALSAGSLAVLNIFMDNVDLQPSFMHMEPLSSGRYWILTAWIPFWILNIMGEEILWRGVVLPRQEISLGKWTWPVNGTGWMLFHVAFGGATFVALWPILLILTYVVQRRRNSWTGVIIHAGVNGPGFLMVAFGLT